MSLSHDETHYNATDEQKSESPPPEDSDSEHFEEQRYVEEEVNEEHIVPDAYDEMSRDAQYDEEYDDDETGDDEDDEPQVEVVPNHVIRASVQNNAPYSASPQQQQHMQSPQRAESSAPGNIGNDNTSTNSTPRKDSTQSLLASHDASIASHRQKLQEHKRWLEEQRMNMPNMREARSGIAAIREAWSPQQQQSTNGTAHSQQSFAPQDAYTNGGSSLTTGGQQFLPRAHYQEYDDEESFHDDDDDGESYGNEHSDYDDDDEHYSEDDQYSDEDISEHHEQREPIESVLLKKGKQSQQYKEQLQRNHMLYEQSVHTFSPKISREPENYHKPGDRIEQRLFELEKHREDRLEQQRQQHLAQYKFKPEVSENSRKIVPERPDILEVEQQWSELRTQKLSSARDERQQQELQNLRETPQLSERTLKLLRSINYRFPNQSISDYHAAKELERAEKIQSLQQEHLRKTMQEKPTISPLSKKLVKKLEREGSVSDRLYQESFRRNMEKEMRSREAATAAEERESLSTNDERRYTFRPDGGNRAYTFSDTASISTDASNRNIYADLVRKGRDIEMKRQMQMEFLAAKEKQLHNKSKINPVSAEIASRLPTSSKDRLYSYKKKKKPDDHNEEFTFKPKINDKSREMIRDYDYQAGGAGGSPRGASTSRIDRLYSMDQRKRERIQSLQEHYEQLEISECTFKPDLKKTKKYMKSYYGFATSPRNNEERTSFSYQEENDDDTEFSTMDGDSANEGNSQFYGLSFHKRAEQWYRKREKKRQEAERMARNSELKECTFSPKTISKESPVTSLITSPRTSLGSPRAVLQDDGNPLGYGQFVTRQREARKRKEEVEQRQRKSPGQSWKNRITQPQPFKLGKERPNKPPVRALQKALSPPTFKKHVQKVQGVNAGDFLLNDDDDDHTKHKPSPLRTDGIPRQGLFSTRSSVQILDSLHNNYGSPMTRKPSLLEDSMEIESLGDDAEDFDQGDDYAL